MSTYMRTIIGRFDESAAALKAIDALVERGYDRSDISFVAKGATEAPSGTTSTSVTSGLAGTALGLATMAIPGIGPILAAGPLAAGLAGASTSAAQADSSWLRGTLSEIGIEGSDTEAYGEVLGRGGALVFVRARETVADSITAILQDNGAAAVNKHLRDENS